VPKAAGTDGEAVGRWPTEAGPRGRRPDGVRAALPRGVIFDLDDTLLDTSGLEAEMLVALCDAVREELGEVEYDALRSRFRNGRDDLYQRVLDGELDIAAYRRAHLIAVCEPWGDPSEALHATAVRLRDEQLGRSRYVEDAVELLRELRAAGVRTGLLTNGPSWMQRRKVELLGLEPELDAIGISEELGAAKPDPAAFAAALQLMDAAPEDTVMVGDHLDWDVHGALAAGLRGAVWVAGDEDDREPPAGALKVARLREVPGALAALA
jgi:putative hydrolase of the HAD superfamily